MDRDIKTPEAIANVLIAAGLFKIIFKECSVSTYKLPEWRTCLSDSFFQVRRPKRVGVPSQFHCKTKSKRLRV